MQTRSGVSDWALSVADRLCARAGTWLSLPGGSLRLAFACCCLSVIARWPGYEVNPANHPKYFVEVLDWQTRHPFQKIPGDILIPPQERRNGFSSHLNKRDTRQVLPLLGFITGLHFSVYAVANHVAGFLFFVLLLHVVRRDTGDPGVAALTALAFALCYSGAHFFEDYYLGDGVAMTCLLAAVATRNRLLVCACVALAGMTDERGIVASLLPLMFWQMSCAGLRPQWRELARVTPQGLAVLVGIAIALAWHETLRIGFGLTSGGTDVANSMILFYHEKNYPGNIIGVFGCLWIVAALAGAAAYLKFGRLASFALAVGAVVSVVPAVLVFDFQRSVAFGSVGVALAMLIARGEPRLLRFAVVLAVLGNALLTPPIGSVARFLR